VEAATITTHPSDQRRAAKRRVSDAHLLQMKADEAMARQLSQQELSYGRTLRAQKKQQNNLPDGAPARSRLLPWRCRRSVYTFLAEGGTGRRWPTASTTTA
jgi:hypothetical protein